MTLFGLLLCKLSLQTLGLDEFGGIVHREASEFFALRPKQRRAGAGIAGVAVRVEGVHPVLVCAGVLRPVLASQECQAFIAVTLSCCGSFGARGFDSLGSFAHVGIILRSPPRDLCSPFG